MKTLRIIYSVIAALCIAACSDIAPESGDNISLCASVGEIAASTKTNVDEIVYKGTTPTSGNPLSAEVWFTTDNSGKYENARTDQTTLLPAHTTIKYIHGSETFPNDELKYPTGSNPPQVYCIGLYPISSDGNAWTPGSENKSVSKTISGSEDLMFAPEISGNWDNRFRTQTYSHLLTWVKICISATSADAINAWGKITEIEIEGENNVTINNLKLTKVSDAIDNGVISYSGNGSFPVLNTATALTTTIQQVGSALCAPPKLENGKLYYTLNIETEHQGTKNVKIEVKDVSGNSISKRSSAAGKLFILSLYFNRIDIIDGVCTLNSWNDQNEDL